MDAYRWKAIARVVVAGHKSAVPATFAGTASMQTDFAVDAVDAVVAVGRSCVDSNRAWMCQTVASEIDCQTWVSSYLVLR